MAVSGSDHLEARETSGFVEVPLGDGPTAFGSGVEMVPSSSSEIQGKLIGQSGTVPPPVVSSSVNSSQNVLVRLIARALAWATRLALPSIQKAVLAQRAEQVGVVRSHTITIGKHRDPPAAVAQTFGDAATDPLEQDGRVSFQPNPQAKERDAALGLKRTRTIPKSGRTFEESFSVAGQEARMKISVIASRERTHKYVENRRATLRSEGRESGEEATACTAMSTVLARESDAVHSSFSREVLPGHLTEHAVGEAPNITIRELTIGTTTTRSLHYGALGDQRNTETSLQQLTLVVEGKTGAAARQAKEEYLQTQIAHKGRLLEELRKNKQNREETEKKIADLKAQKERGEGGRYIDREIQNFEDTLRSIDEFILVQQAELEKIKDVERDLEHLQDMDQATKHLDETRTLLQSEQKKLQDAQAKLDSSSPEYEKITKRLANIAYMIGELENPRKALVQRREIVYAQMTTVLEQYAVLAAQNGKVQSDRELHIADIRLLNPQKRSVDAMSQLSINEGRLIEDGAQAFRDFDGIPVEFTNQGSPSVDRGPDGKPTKVRLPCPEGVNEGTQCTLRTHFADVPVWTKKQMRTETIQTLAHLNAGVFDDVTKGLESRITELTGSPRTPDDEIQLSRLQYSLSAVQAARKRMKAGGVSYENASVLKEACTLLGWETSLGCFSCKDRGGYAGRKAALEAQIHEQETRARQSEGKQAERSERAARDLRSQIPRAVDTNSCEMGLVRWTVPSRQRTLKVWSGFKEVGSVSRAFRHLSRALLDKRASD